MLTIELRYLVYTALLAGSLWIPFIVGINVTDFPGKRDLSLRPADPMRMVAWVHRSFRAHLNALEQLLPFAVIVLVGALAHVSTPTTRVCAQALFWLRVVHAIGVPTGLLKLPFRPMVYFAGWVAMLVFASQILFVAPAG